jgi:hypothetical protein
MSFTAQVTEVFDTPTTSAVNRTDLRTSTDCWDGLTVIRSRMLALAVPDLLESARLTALTVTVPEAGTMKGAVYRPEAEIVPTVVFPPSTSFTNQVTAESKLPVP